MLVVIVGNTHTRLGAFDQEALVRHDRYPTAAPPPPHPDPGCPTGIVSVVPRAAEALCRVWAAYDPILLTSETCPLPLAYDPPTALGADRVANALGLHARFGGPAIAVDLGTATSLTAIGPDGTVLGGAIAPGLETGRRALRDRTAQLPEVELADPGVPWGRTTAESLQIGLLAGHVGMVRHLVERMRGGLGSEVPVALTGGGSWVLAAMLPDYYHLPDLTLEGGRIWLQHAARAVR